MGTAYVPASPSISKRWRAEKSSSIKLIRLVTELDDTASLKLWPAAMSMSVVAVASKGRL